MMISDLLQWLQGLFDELAQHLVPSNTHSAEAVLYATVEFRMLGSLQPITDRFVEAATPVSATGRYAGGNGLHKADVPQTLHESSVTPRSS
jgi:hypothetical protein